MRRVVLVFMLTALASCNTGSGAGASTDASPAEASSDAAADVSGTPCLASPPGDGTMCGPQGLSCEYGSATVVACNTVATCNGGRWQVIPPTDGGTLCTSGKVPQCPASLSAVSVGQHCSPLALVCDYPSGRCACDVRTGAPVTDASAQASWICPSPDPGCPAPRPLLGSPCTKAGLACDYGTCAIPGATAQRCLGGIWVEQSSRCGGP